MRRIQIKDVFDLQMGKTPSRKNYAYWTGGTIDWVSKRDLGTYDRYVGTTKERITQLAVDDSGIKPVPPNTLIFDSPALPPAGIRGLRPTGLQTEI